MPTGNGVDMLKSIDKLLKLPGNTLVYPGHNQTTIIEEEQE